MAKANIIAEFIKTDVAHEVKLRVYENKQGLRGTLLDSYGHKISGAMFYEKDGDKDLHRVAEYFGFSMENVRYNSPK